jgi:hypothetical protein
MFRIAVRCAAVWTSLIGVASTQAGLVPVVREIESSVDHNHCTTRQFQHMCFKHGGTWFVFYSDGKDFVFQTSVDEGRSWERGPLPVATAPNGSTSHDILRVGDEVIMSYVHYPLGRYDVTAPYARDPSRRHEYTFEGRIKKARIEGRRIAWGEEVAPGFRADYGNLVRGDDGYLWLFSRDEGRGIVRRSRRPDDITGWQPMAVCIPNEGRHAMDATALDAGNLYVASVLTTGGELVGNLFDGTEWTSEATLLDGNMTKTAGDDRRLAMEFDPTAGRLHLAYVDADSRLRYRCLERPYESENWRPPLSRPAKKLAENVFTCALSVDSSRQPYGLIVTYGVQKHVGNDRRERTGELYARRLDGTGTWIGGALLVSQPGTIHNWYPNVNRDAREGLCVMYSRSVNRRSLGKPLAVMVTVVKRVD